jgi:hypothetical protein
VHQPDQDRACRAVRPATLPQRRPLVGRTSARGRVR